MANDQPYNIIGVVGSAISILSAAITVWLLYCRLPRSKLQSLESLLSETEKLLNSAVQEGIVDGVTLCQFHERLFLYVSSVRCGVISILTHCGSIKGLVHNIRAEVYNTHNAWQDVKNWWKGLSLRMSKVCSDMRALRAEISVSDARPSQKHVTHFPTQGRCSDAASAYTKEDATLLETSFKEVPSPRSMYMDYRRCYTPSPLTSPPQLSTHSVVWKNFLWTAKPLPRPSRHPSSFPQI